MYVSESKFKSYIKSAPPPPPPPPSQWKVRQRNGNLIPLKEYITAKDRTAIKHIDLFIKNIDIYLTNYYQRSLEPTAPHDTFPPPMKITQLNNNAAPEQKNRIRNLHFKSILENTEPGIKNLRPFLKVVKELLKGIIDYKLLTPSAQFYIKNGRMGSVLSSYYFRASIMNPYLVYSIAHHYNSPHRVFTPTLGWTSYMCGFLEAGTKEYVGVDVIPSVCEKTRAYAAQYYPQNKVDIYCQPSETLKNSPTFLNKYKNYFDMIFFSPPYYDYEKYEGTNQSINKYKTYEEWLTNYWEETIKLCVYVLRKSPDAHLIYIISSYEGYDLVKDMNDITKKYMKFSRSYDMSNKNVHVTKHRETNEKLYVFTPRTAQPPPATKDIKNIFGN